MTSSVCSRQHRPLFLRLAGTFAAAVALVVVFAAAPPATAATVSGTDGLDYAALAADGPLVADPSQANCAGTAAGRSILPALQGLVKPAIAATFAAIKLAAPNAEIFVLGYPSITPDEANTPAEGCFRPLSTPNSFPFTTTDVPFLHSVEQALDAVIQTETQAADLNYVPTIANSLAHTACASAESAYISGITVVSQDPVVVAPGALHPNAAGQQYMAAALSAYVVSAFPDATTPDPGTPAPVIPVAVPGAAAPVPTLAATGATAPQILGGGLLALLFMAVGGGAILSAHRTRAAKS